MASSKLCIKDTGPSTESQDFINRVGSTPKQPHLDHWTGLLRGRNFSYRSQANNPIIPKWQGSKFGFEAGVKDIVQSASVTARIVFQSAYSLLLALLETRCLRLPDYWTQRDCKPTNVPLQETQAAFWDSTENGLVSLSEIYKALGENRHITAAKCLFCFEPFEPVLAQQDRMRLIVMKMSKNRIQFNYAIQLEGTKRTTKGEYVIKFGFDDQEFSVEQVQAALA
ncbi:Nonribosomal peptide synthetase 7 [Talaromyces islandicus]|uniref:Nonribosomal peptide synthetase 7 n=1 Tax=Talaromyces islandicus TaxID=28573 RepID=A0A0U1LKX6_TALIS|nr:Nonribosomal peptide synthetase 7 [Talaromyces islandicus]